VIIWPCIKSNPLVIGKTKVFFWWVDLAPGTPRCGSPWQAPHSLFAINPLRSHWWRPRAQTLQNRQHQVGITSPVAPGGIRQGGCQGGGAFVDWLFCILLSLLSHCRCSMAVVVAPLLFMCGYQNPIRPWLWRHAYLDINLCLCILISAVEAANCPGKNRIGECPTGKKPLYLTNTI